MLIKVKYCIWQDFVSTFELEMIGKSSNKLSLLALVSLLFLGAFITYWMQSTYQKERTELLEKAEFAMKRSIGHAEREVWYSTFIDVVNQNSDSTSITPKGDTIVNLRMVFFDTLLNRKVKEPARFVQFNENDSEDSYAQRIMVSRPSARPRHNKSPMRSFIYSHINTESFWKNIEDSIAQHVIEEEYNFTLNASFSKEKDIDSAAFHTELFTLSDGSYSRAQIVNGPVLLLKRILPALLTSLLLFGVSAFAFINILKHLKQQRLLAEKQRDFMYNMTHELNTPATTIGLALEAIEHRQDLSKEKQQEYVGMAGKALGRLQDMIKRVLDSAKMENDALNMEQHSTNIVELTNQVAASRESLLASNTTQQFTFSKNVDELTISTDQHHVTNVLENLLDNAFKYSGDNAQVSLDLHKNNKNVIWSVTDNGPGIKANDQHHIFNKFYRASNGTIHNVKGYGLGLHYAKVVATKLGGNVEYKKNPKGGSIFSLVLPISANGN